MWWLGPLLVSLVAQLVKNMAAMQVTSVQSLSQEDALEKGIQPMWSQRIT